MNSSSEKNETFQAGELQENLEILRQIYFFSGLSMETLKVIAYICNRETFKEGEHLFRQDEDDGQAFYVLSGNAQLLHKDDKGEHKVSEYGSGEFIGGLALLGKMHRHFSLRAMTDLTCLIFERDKFQSTLQQFQDLMPKIIKSIVERISAWEGQFLVAREEGCDVCMHKVGVSLI